MCVIALGSVAIAFLSSSCAHADTFSFSFSGSNFSGSGYFDATEIGTTGSYNIYSVYGGSVIDVGMTSSAIIGILGVNAFQNNDNVLIYPGTFGYYGDTYFSQNGVSFSLADGSDVNLNDASLFGNAVSGPTQGGDITELALVNVGPPSSPVPEPSSLAVLGTGVLAAVGAIQRRLVTQ